MQRVIARMWRAAIRNRARVVGAILAIAAAAGYTVAPEAREAILTLAGVLGTAAVGGEAVRWRRNRQPRDEQGRFTSGDRR